MRISKFEILHRRFPKRITTNPPSPKMKFDETKDGWIPIIDTAKAVEKFGNAMKIPFKKMIEAKRTSETSME